MRWVAVLLLLPAPALAQDATLFVENATGAQDLISMLREEIPDTAFAETATIADLRARLTEALRLSIVDRSGITLVDRAIEGEREAAVRVASLLIVEARESWRPVESEPLAVERAVTATVASRGWYVGAAAGVGLGMWSSRAQLAFAGSVYFGISDFELGAAFSIAGLGCTCAVRTESLRVEPTAIAVVAEGRWWFWRPLSALETAVWIAGGYQRERVASRVIGGFASDGPLETVTFAGAIGRAGFGIGSLLFELLRIRADVGLQLQPSVRVSLPQFDEYRGAPGAEVSRGVVVPWAALSIGLVL